MKLISFIAMVCIGIHLGASPAQAAFDENARRYLSAQELIQSLAMFFPFEYGTTAGDCKTVNSKNSTLLGLSSPLTGNPIAPGPTQATVQWITECVSSSLSGFTSGDQKFVAQLRDLVGAEVYDAEPSLHYGNITYSLWKNLSTDVRTKVIAHAVNALLGSDEVIQDFGLIEPDVLRSKMANWADQRPQLTVFEMIRFLSINLALRDEFLSY